MKSIARKLVLGVLLGATLGAHAAFVPFPDGEFSSGQGSWGRPGPAAFLFPGTGGNPGGFCTINANGAGQWGVLVSGMDNGSFLSLASLGLVAGNGYTFKMDMQIQPGSTTNNLGKLNLVWQGAPATGDMPTTYIDGNWNTHTFPVIIPADATGVKVVPVCNNNNFVGFDNVGFESVPYFIAPPPPTGVVLQDPFDVASPNWVAGAPPGGGTRSVTWSNTEGNPAGSTIIEATNPAGAGSNVAFTYTRTGVDFGTTGPVKVSFDAKGTALVATALHVRINGNFFGAIQGSFNNTNYTTYTQTFNLPQGFQNNTFTMTFEMAMGAVAGAGGSYSIDNIKVLSNLPDAQPFAARIATGTLVGWTPTAAENIYQPQESANGIDYTNLGPALTGTAVSSAFDPTPASSYRVLQAAPVIQDVAFNGGFEENFLGDYLVGWVRFGNQQPVLIETDPRTGTRSIRIKATATVADPGPPPTYAAGVSGFEQNTTNATNDNNSGGPLVTPGNTYSFSFWAKQIVADPGYVQNYRIAWLNSIGAIVGDGGFQGFSGAIGAWEQKVQNGLVAPAGATSAQILIQGLTGAFSGSMGEVIIDDISLKSTGTGVATVLPGTTTGPAAEISWDSKTGFTYNVKSSSNLSGFAPFAGPFAGTDSIMKVYDAPLVTRKFYQVSEN